MRKDCNYRFCDKTRFVQHTARHERLDTLCGQEFEGFRGVSCSREACEFNIVNSRGKISDSENSEKSILSCSSPMWQNCETRVGFDWTFSVAF